MIYVYDNGSTDHSVEVALAAGAKVKHVAIRDKGQVVRSMFADIEADIYVMIDGDDTYDVKPALPAINLVQELSLDMAI
jgi:glycosyltransferase involved in cell wall biosynthesis